MELEGKKLVCSPCISGHHSLLLEATPESSQWGCGVPTGVHLEGCT